MVFACLLFAALLPAAPSCSPTALDDRLPGVVAPMAGQYPVWLVDGSGGEWPGAGSPVKSLWVLARDFEGRLRVQGRRIDGRGVMGFTTASDSAGFKTFVAEDPAAASVVPGGAAPEVMEHYAFVPIYLRYPSPGCWELHVQLGHETVRIVQELR